LGVLSQSCNLNVFGAVFADKIVSQAVAFVVIRLSRFFFSLRNWASFSKHSKTLFAALPVIEQLFNATIAGFVFYDIESNYIEGFIYSHKNEVYSFCFESGQPIYAPGE
jgi:hypothetical protein